MITFLFLFLNWTIFLLAEVYDCNTKNVNLKKNELVFFETTNYPRFLTFDEFYACNTTFSFAKITTKKHRLFVVSKLITYSDLAGLTADDLNTETYYENFNFTFDFFFDYDTMGAFQALLFFDEGNDSCPLEAVCKPFIFTNESQILHIFSSYEEKHIRTYPCKWNFIAPNYYGFKIVIVEFDVSSTTKFTIKNTTQMIVNERSAKLLHPYYNNDNEIEIFLSEGNPSYITDMEFHAYITVIKLNQEKLKKNCTFVFDGESYTWTSFLHDKKGYDNNMYCNFVLNIPPNIEIYVDAGINLVEEGVDTVKYYPEQNNMAVSLVKSQEFMLEPYYNGSNRHILWEFESDGSYQLAGLAIAFEKLVCQCADNIVPCDKLEYLLMDNIHGYYCGNMNCSFIIQPCNSSFTLIEISSENDEPLFDIFTVISGGEVVLEINRPKTYLYVTLSSNVAHFAFRTHFNRFALVQQDQNVLTDVIFVYTPDTNSVSFYNNESLTFGFIGNICFVTSNFIYKCKMKNNKLVVFVNNPDASPFVVLKSSERSKGCIFKQNVFVVSELSNLTVTAVSNSADICEIVILIKYTSAFCISKVWTTSAVENVKIFDGNDQIHPLFEFNSTSSKEWKSVTVNSYIYTVKLPIRSALTMNFLIGECKDT